MALLNTYRQILDGRTTVACESKQNYELIFERHLQAMWLEQRYFRDLQTHQGEPIEVISPGIWNAEAGPDFCKAHLRIGGREYFGDVEIHLSDGSWYHHRHHTDPRYNKVILHVSLWPSTKETVLLADSGSEILRTYLEPRLTIPLKRIVQLIDLDLYPYKKFVGSGRCAHSLFRSMPQSQLEELFSSAAFWRLEKKLAFLEARIEDPSLRFPAGVAMAMGYKVNADQFLELYLWLQKFSHKPFEKIFPIALGVSGFFEEPYLQRWSKSTAYQQLLAVWKNKNPSLTERFPLVVGQSRPLNHPLRRLVTLCHLVIDPAQRELLAQCLNIWETGWASCQKIRDFSRLRDELTAQIPVYQNDYWNSHYLFEEEASPVQVPLMGQELRQVALVNTLLPLLFGKITERQNPRELAAFSHLFGAIRAPSSGKQRYLVHRFFGETPKGKLLAKTVFEQGAFQIHRDFCVHYEASCEGCPFVDRVNGLGK